MKLISFATHNWKIDNEKRKDGSSRLKQDRFNLVECSDTNAKSLVFEQQSATFSSVRCLKTISILNGHDRRYQLNDLQSAEASGHCKDLIWTGNMDFTWENFGLAGFRDFCDQKYHKFHTSKQWLKLFQHSLLNFFVILSQHAKDKTTV